MFSLRQTNLRFQLLQFLGAYGRAQELLRGAGGQLLLGLEDSLDHMLWIGDSLLRKNKITTTKKIVNEFKKINAGDIKRIAKQILNNNKFNLAVVGPVAKKQEKAIKSILNVDI